MPVVYLYVTDGQKQVWDRYAHAHGCSVSALGQAIADSLTIDGDDPMSVTPEWASIFRAARRKTRTNRSRQP